MPPPRGWGPAARMAGPVAYVAAVTAALWFVHRLAPQLAPAAAWWRVGLGSVVLIALMRMVDGSSVSSFLRARPRWAGERELALRTAVAWAIGWWVAFFANVSVVFAPVMDDLSLLALFAALGFGMGVAWLVERLVPAPHVGALEPGR